MTVNDLDWATLRAVAIHFDADPHELDRLVDIDRRYPDRESAPHGFCEHVIRRSWMRGFCGRPSTAHFGHLALCWQHENSLVDDAQYWVRRHAPLRDLTLITEALLSRLKALAHEADKWPDTPHPEHGGSASEIRERLRAGLAEFITTDTEDSTREALEAIWGTS